MIKFKDLGISEEIVKSLDSLGYKNPSEVQEKVIAKALEGLDIVVQSKTGSGKTASFGIPICNELIWEENKPQALVLTPTRELAIQVKEEIKNIGRFKRIKATVVFGKSPFSEQARELKQKTHVVVGTPGRVKDHIDRQTLDLSKIKYLIIDEGDEMLNMGFIDQVKSIIEELSENRQTILLSATMPNEVIELCNKYMKNPTNIEIKSQNIVTETIEHKIYRVNENYKLDDLNKLLICECPNSAVIFCKTKENVDNVFNMLRRKRYSIGKIHGGMMQKDRMESMDNFKKGYFRILIATDVAARGIDVEDLSYVINYDLPVEKEAYVHRIGRTGRAGKKGKALSLVNQYEDNLLKSIEEYINLKIEEEVMPSIGEVKNKEEESFKLLRSNPKIKKDKAINLNKNITKIYLNGGKKKKIRALDIVGTISRIDGIKSDDIGIIDIQDTVSYVDILNGKGNIVIEGLKNATIKGKKLKVERARK